MLCPACDVILYERVALKHFIREIYYFLKKHLTVNPVYTLFLWSE